MIKNYIKTAWRNLWKNKFFSIINIAGLAIGMTACLLILQYVSFELSYDQFNKNAADIYRVYNDRYQNGKLIQHGTITYSAIGKAMQDDYPEVINHARVEPLGQQSILSYNDKKIGDLQGLAADNSFLSMFSYPLITGDVTTALNEPNTMLLSKALAKKIFSVNDNDLPSLLGKAIVMGRDSLPYKITAICKDIPENSHLQFDFLISYSSLYSGNEKWSQADYDFTDSDFWHYIQLKHATDYKVLQAKLSAFSQRHFQGNKVSGSDERFYLQPLTKAHLYSDFEYEIGKTGNATVVWGLLIIAILIIIIAWINYINLSTAKSMERAREVGVRKVAGATKKQLIRQFLSESFFINIIALLIAILFVISFQNSFNNLIHHDLSLFYLLQNGLNGFNIISALALLIIVGIFVSGFYPAFVLSSFKPILVLKGKFTTSGKGILLRKILVTGQFVVTVALIIGSIVVYRQIRFMNQQKLGLNIDQVMIIKPPILTNWDSTFISRIDNFKEEIKQLANVKGAATSRWVPGNETGRNFGVRQKSADANTHFTVRQLGISYDFIDLYGMNLVAGRKFLPSDYNTRFKLLHNIILNETAVKLLGFSSSQNAIGKTILTGDKEWEIAGVVADFHQKSLKYSVEPTLLMPLYGTNHPISVKLMLQDLPQTIAAVKNKYETFFPGNIFDYYFLDEKFNDQYSNDQLFGKVFGAFSILAIFVACLGLLGLSLFATAQRTKEIGVRKVLGASVSNILLLLSKESIRLIIIAFIIAIPVSWYVMHLWLQDFAYRIHISWWIFLVAGALALMIALITISFQAIKAAIANPVKSLRTE